MADGRGEFRQRTRLWLRRQGGKSPSPERARSLGGATQHPPAQSTPDQNSSFSANWIWRAEPESPVGRRVDGMTPKLVLPTGAVRAASGKPKFGGVKMLKA